MRLKAFFQTKTFLFPFFLGSFFLPFCAFPFLSNWDSSKWLFLYSITGVSLLSLKRNSSFVAPKLRPYQQGLLLGLLILFIFNFFFHPTSFFEKEFVDRLLFWTLFFYFCSTLYGTKNLEKRGVLPLFWGTALFIILSFLNFIFVSPYLSFTFGNLNKSAEFVGLSLALQLGLVSQFKNKGKKLLLILICFSLAYLYFTKCRSAWLGVTGIVMYLIGTRALSLKDILSITLGTCFLIGFFELIFNHIDRIPMILSLKEDSILERWSLLQNTLSLIYDFPLGVGLGHYGDAAIPYMKNLPKQAFIEGYSVFSPHNEILRFIAEDGLPAFLIFILFLLSFIFPLDKIKKISTQCPESMAFFIFLLIQCLFQFPFIQPFPLLIVPFCLAYTFAFTKELKAFPSPLWKKGANVLGVFFLIMTLLQGTAWIVAQRAFNTLTLNKSVYTLWKDRSLLVNILILTWSEGRYAETKNYALQALKIDPSNPQALKFLGLAEWELGNISKGCEILKKYESFYAKPTTIHQKVEEVCSKKSIY